MGWFDNIQSPKLKKSKKSPHNMPAGLWKKCSSCGEILNLDRLEKNHNVCPYCDFHYRLSASDRLQLLLDDGKLEVFKNMPESLDPLKFEDKKNYSERLKETQKKTGLKDSVVAGIGKINGQSVSMAIMDFSFMGGSMGVACGEVIAMTMDQALKEKIPCIVVSCSGGARMQEGILSLMQMGKTSASRKKLRDSKIPYISVLTDPTTGGCAASFAMLGDINIAEPNALIGFAGPRVIEQSIRQKLPEGFQRSEFLRDHGFVDRVSHRLKLKNELSFFIKMFSSKK
ncbi:MAG: acetyl-CoA carboxylase carboxyltransferase subunit beta [Halobacteriovoraceae bacterium]|nr:acetyl-CoA carboxylase carboxyltransferase subunit beta [Halobacteriovoraceae bacterium]